MNSPFDPNDEAAYRRWRARKLAAAPTSLGELSLALASDAGPSVAELERIRRCGERANMALIRLPEGWERSGAGLRRLAAALGLARLDQNLCADEDGISAIRVADQRRANEYVPYTDRPLSWHTDGYYNAPERQIRAWALLCVRPAAEGGENQLLDPEIAYLLLRDEDPELARALMQPDALSIPPNIEAGREIRPARVGPVFSVANDGSLHMRYSARQRNIRWKPGATAAAAAFLLGLFSSGSPYIFRHRLQPGEVLVSNNVLHNRSGFRDSETADRRRLLFRARYFDRIAGTAPVRSRGNQS
jgi:alpha-ketoglutarate-dependent taurine dioxygenase